MKSLRPAPLATALALALALTACSQDAGTPTANGAAQAAAPDIDWTRVTTEPNRLLADEIDPSVPACVDFNAHVNARWLDANPVPSDRTSWGSFELLGERSLEIQHELARAAAEGDAAEGSIERRIGDFFASGMDTDAIEAAGLDPIRPLLDEIAAIQDRQQLVAHLQQAYADARGGAFGFWAGADFEDSQMQIAYASQGGLTLPERSYYLEDREDYVRIREAFLDYVADVLEATGHTADAARASAEAILAFETRLAEASLDRVSLRNPANRYNPVGIEEANALTPSWDWGAFFDTLQVDRPQMFSLGMPGFFEAFESALAEAPVETWQDWLSFRLVSGASPYLSSSFADRHFGFFNTTLLGQQEQRERWKRVLGTVNGGMGEALGQLYVAVAFPPESKTRMEELVENLSQALKVRLENLDWMGEETRERALEKWSTFTPKIGYPDQWRSWDGLEIGRDSYVGNVMAANRFNYRFMLDKIGQPVDPHEWGMSPQTVNAYYRASANEIVFPAAILQPPFFDPDADDALNYGGIGAVIGHEMLHGYDDQGSRFDAEGNFANWWTDEDRRRFEERTAKLVQQFDEYEALPGIYVQGALALGENIADLGGLTVAHDAMRLAQGEDFVDPMIDGWTQDQRFFKNWAVVWRRGFTEEQLRVALTTGPHAPAPFRAIGAPSNMPAFAEAFGCQSGDPMVRDGDDRVVIW